VSYSEMNLTWSCIFSLETTSLGISNQTDPAHVQTIRLPPWCRC